MSNVFRLPLVLTAQPEGGYTVNSPVLPGLVTEGDSMQEALAHVEDAFKATLELYADRNRALPEHLVQDAASGSIQFDHLLLSA